MEQNLPYEYQKFKNIFSKVVFNVLLPHQLYNYKIKIKPSKEDTLSYSPLRQQFIVKLQAIKQYIINNLGRGFIKPS